MITCDFHLQRGDFTLNFTEELSGQGITAITGKSGSGKTTLLRLMLGLESHANATFIVNDTIYQQGNHFIPPEKRAIGYVGQETRLLPFLSIEKNISFAQKRALSGYQLPKLSELIEVFAVEHCLNKRPDALSSGEKQRVATIQMLMNCPMLLLLDEAFSAIDEARKQIIWDHLAHYFAQVQLPVIYVTHDNEELKMVKPDNHIHL